MSCTLDCLLSALLRLACCFRESSGSGERLSSNGSVTAQYVVGHRVFCHTRRILSICGAQAHVAHSRKATRSTATYDEIRGSTLNGRCPYGGS